MIISATNMPATVIPISTTDLLTGGELSPAELNAVLETAIAVKREPLAYEDALKGKSIVMLFEKPSLRTRVSFEVGAAKLGAKVVYFDHSSSRIGQREPVSDYGSNLSLWTDCVVARVFDHAVIESLANHASVPVINALSDIYHPCQALADLLSLKEVVGGGGDLKGAHLAFMGDGNNVCNSLMLGAAALGMKFTVVCPAGYEPDPQTVKQAGALIKKTGGVLTITDEIDAVYAADAVYTDTWTSMGQESEQAARLKTFAPYQVNDAVMMIAGENAKFMHCLPAHRGEEVTAGIIDGPRSIVLRQAENRMHAQNALLLHLLAS
jgi:ornithine carbamoyltransferase